MEHWRMITLGCEELGKLDQVKIQKYRHNERASTVFEGTVGELGAELERLQLYEPVHQSLRWYLRARGGNEEETAAASQQVLTRFEAAEAAAKSKGGDSHTGPE